MIYNDKMDMVDNGGGGRGSDGNDNSGSVVVVPIIGCGGWG